MTVIGNPRSFHKKFKFVVEIDDVGHAGFQKASEPLRRGRQRAVLRGRLAHPEQEPRAPHVLGRHALERGATQDRDLFDWFQDRRHHVERPRPHRRELQAQPRHRAAGPRRPHPAPLVALARAWPVKFVAGEWDNESDENVIESVTPTYDFFELVQ